MREPFHSTQRSRASRRQTRGAAMVEAAIVISLLALGMTGLIFFVNYYAQELTVSRLARGTAIAYAEQGCPDNSRPADWIGTVDKRTFNVNSGAHSSEMAQDDSNRGNSANPPASGDSTQDGRNKGLTSNIGLGDDGKSITNPITMVAFDGKVRTYEKGRGLRADRTIFQHDLMGRSFVTCGEEMKEGSVNAVFDKAKSAFSDLLKFKP